MWKTIKVTIRVNLCRELVMIHKAIMTIVWCKIRKILKRILRRRWGISEFKDLAIVIKWRKTSKLSEFSSTDAKPKEELKDLVFWFLWYRSYYWSKNSWIWNQPVKIWLVVSGCMMRKIIKRQILWWFSLWSSRCWKFLKTLMKVWLTGIRGKIMRLTIRIIIKEELYSILDSKINPTFMSRLIHL